jgi:hypothetical protein
MKVGGQFGHFMLCFFSISLKVAFGHLLDMFFCENMGRIWVEKVGKDRQPKDNCREKDTTITISLNNNA